MNSTPVQREISFETALWQAATELASGRADLALAGAADELNQYRLAAGMRWGWWPDVSATGGVVPPPPTALGHRLPAGEGAAVYALGRRDAGEALAYVSAIRIGHSGDGRDTGTPPWDALAEAEWIIATCFNATALPLAKWIIC